MLEMPSSSMVTRSLGSRGSAMMLLQVWRRFSCASGVSTRPPRFYASRAGRRIRWSLRGAFSVDQLVFLHGFLDRRQQLFRPNRFHEIIHHALLI